jgi:hypothetical protein
MAFVRGLAPPFRLKYAIYRKKARSLLYVVREAAKEKAYGASSGAVLKVGEGGKIQTNAAESFFMSLYLLIKG